MILIVEDPELARRSPNKHVYERGTLKRKANALTNRRFKRQFPATFGSVSILIDAQGIDPYSSGRCCSGSLFNGARLAEMMESRVKIFRDVQCHDLP
jgi:hypothetical protein